MQQRPSRPTGVTILGVLAILAGIAGLLGGFLLIGASQIVGTLNLATVYPGLAGLSLDLVTAVLLAFGVILMLLGILWLAVGIGFFGGKGWGWTLGIIVSAISVVLSIAEIAIGSFGSVLGLVVGLLILYYLTRPHVKAFFGKGPPTMAPSPMTQPSTPT